MTDPMPSRPIDRPALRSTPWSGDAALAHPVPPASLPEATRLARRALIQRAAAVGIEALGVLLPVPEIYDAQGALLPDRTWERLADLVEAQERPSGVAS